MYKRILVPLDGSLLAEQALPHAISIAKCYQSELVLLQVLISLPRVTETTESAIQRAEKTRADMVREYLESIAAKVQEHDIPVEFNAVKGSPHAQILQYTENNQMDLIVMCSRGQSGLSRWMIGSVSDRVMRGAMVPVLLVRALN